jgi:hypothetical protein
MENGRDTCTLLDEAHYSGKFLTAEFAAFPGRKALVSPSTHSLCCGKGPGDAALLVSLVAPPGGGETKQTKSSEGNHKVLAEHALAFPWQRRGMPAEPRIVLYRRAQPRGSPRPWPGRRGPA